MGAIWADKKIVLKYCLLLFDTTVNHFWDCDMKWKVGFMWQPATASSVVGRSSSKSTSQSQTCTKKKGMVTDGLLSIWSTPAFSPGETVTSEKCAQKIDEMHRKLQHLQLAVANRAQFSTKPDCPTPEALVLWCANWALKLCLICHIRLTSRPLTTTSSSILITFCREKASTTSKMQKMLSKSLLNHKVQIFTLQK